jgi:hypothetical protein
MSRHPCFISGPMGNTMMSCSTGTRFPWGLFTAAVALLTAFVLTQALHHMEVWQ